MMRWNRSKIFSWEYHNLIYQGFSVGVREDHVRDIKFVIFCCALCAREGGRGGRGCEGFVVSAG